MVMESNLHQLTTQIVIEFVANNTVRAEDLPSVIQAVYGSLAQLGKEKPVPPDEEPLIPAVSIKKSLMPDYLVCLDCGEKVKMLKRHIEAQHGLSADDYRSRWKLSSEYPMTAPNYSVRRSALAKDLGLGTRFRPKGRQ
jgi:predicted transcriptional regulator